MKMRRFAVYGALALALAVLGAGGQDAPAGGDAKLQDELKDVLRQLREARAASYQRQRTRNEGLDAARTPLKRLEIELSELRAREQEADRNLAEVKSELAKLQKDEAADSYRATLGPDLEKALKEARDFVEKGIPYRLADRGQRLGAPGEGGPADQFGRYWSFLQEEFRVARSGEAYSAEVPLDGGRAKPARLFRVGHLLLGYVTEDGLQAGLWNGTQWVAPASPEEERRIRGAVETLDRRRAPALLSLPVLRKGAP